MSNWNSELCSSASSDLASGRVDTGSEWTSGLLVASVLKASAAVTAVTTAAATAVAVATASTLGVVSTALGVVSLGADSASAAAAALGPRFTGMGVLLPTVFLGLVILAVLLFALGVFGLAVTSFEEADLVSLGLLVLASPAAFEVKEGFLEADSGLAGVVAFGVSGFVGLVEAGRVRGEAAGFLAAGVDGLLTSFLMGVVVFVNWAGVRPAGGAVVLAGDGLAPEVVVLAVEGEDFDADVDVLVAAEAVGFGAADAGREVVVPVAGLVVLETGGLSVLGEEVVPGLVVVAEAGLGAVVFGLALSPFTGAAGVFLAGCVVPVVLAALAGAVAGRVVPIGFFSVVLGAVLVVTAPAGFLDGAVVDVVFFSGPAPAVFLATPLVCVFCTPFVRRL